MQNYEIFKDESDKRHVRILLLKLLNITQKH